MLKVEPLRAIYGTLTMEAWRLKISPWRVCRPAVANSQHFDEERARLRICIQVK
jgi:hypothetical protein